VTTRIDLLDVNVWLALSVPEHPHHPLARDYWQGHAAERLAFCRVTMLGFLRLLTHPTVMGDQPLGATEAWLAYETWRGTGDVVLVAEPDACELLLAEWSRAGRLSPRLWTDAYLAAFALGAGYRLVSFDGDFTRFDGLELLLLGR
jgi:toxin-antitoxin system PIN domain toxin